jgi:branched-chain amino acid transport system substrate-binding protein
MTGEDNTPSGHDISSEFLDTSITRRRLLQGGIASAGALALSGLLGAGTDALASVRGATSVGRTIKLGYVSPETGPLAPFGQADKFVIANLQKVLADGIVIKGTRYPFEVIVEDSQSTDARAAQVASDLINNSHIDLMLVSSTPDVTNPVADQCEANSIPCISTVAPWQSWFFGRGATPKTVYKWTYHFFWGLEDLEAVYYSIWLKVPNNKVIGALWPNDPDGLAFAAKATGFPAFVDPKGYTVINPGQYPDGDDQFTSQISDFISHNAEILTGVPQPPDFITFYQQAAQQGYKPKVATIAKAMLFPSSAYALGSLAQNISSEVWWGPTHPYQSSLTGQSAGTLAGLYETQTNNQWTQPIGFVHALFEVAFAAYKKAGTVDSKEALVGALSKLALNTIVGPLNWATGPVPNVTKTPLVGGQWRKGSKYPYELVIVTNTEHPNIPTAGTPEAIQ